MFNPAPFVTIEVIHVLTVKRTIRKRGILGFEEMGGDE